MGDVVGGLFGDTPDYVGDNLEAQKKALAQAMEKGRELADSQYSRNKQAAYDTAALNRYNQVTPYGSLTWYNTNDPQEAQRLAEADRLNSFVNKMVGGANDVDFNTIRNAAEQFLGSDPVAAREAMGKMYRGQLIPEARDVYNQQVADRNAQVADLQGRIDSIDPYIMAGLQQGYTVSDPTLSQQLGDSFNVPASVFQDTNNLNAENLIAQIPQAQELLKNYNQAHQDQKAAYNNAVQNYQQPNGDIGIGTTRQFKDPTLEQK